MFIFINLIIVNVGNEGIVKKLIASGVDVNSENNEGETPLYYSVRMSESIFFLLYWSLLSWNLNVLSVLKDHANIVDVLADNGADVNREVKGINMLLIAAIKGIVICFFKSMWKKYK